MSNIQNNNFPVQVFDSESEKWMDMVCSICSDMISIGYPKKSSVLNIDIKKGLVLRNASLDIMFTDRDIILRSFRNWLRISFSRPLLCNHKDILFQDQEKSVKIEIGFPFEEPIIIRGVNDKLGKIKGVRHNPVRH